LQFFPATLFSETRRVPVQTPGHIVKTLMKIELFMITLVAEF
jgi:hypothetical protein